MPEEAHDTPAEVTASEGDVNVEGPGGISYAFTPDAAVETSDRLLVKAAEARGQQIEEERRQRKPL